MPAAGACNAIVLLVHLHSIMGVLQATRTLQMTHQLEPPTCLRVCCLQVYVDVTAKSGLARASYVFNKQQVRAHASCNGICNAIKSYCSRHDKYVLHALPACLVMLRG